jgi:hypothetical protein
MMEQFNLLRQKYPFFTLCSYASEEFIGVMENSSENLISVYCYKNITDEKNRNRFLELCDEWWWSSNRTVSIDVFLKPDFDVFKPYLKHFNAKEVTILAGPVISMSGAVKKRIKRRTIELMRK